MATMNDKWVVLTDNGKRIELPVNSVFQSVADVYLHINATERSDGIHSISKEEGPQYLAESK